MLDRTTPPASYPIDHFELPAYEHLQLAGLADCYVIKDDKLPVVHIELLFESGKSSQSIPGTAYYAIKMLPEGSKSHNAEEIANGFESLGSFVEFSSGMDHSSIKIYSQASKINTTLDLLEEVLTTPAFPDAEYRTLQDIRAQQIAMQHAKNNQYATLKFNQLLFGENHAHGYMLSPSDVKELSLDSVVEFYHQTIFRNPKVFITGLVEDTVMEKLASLVKGLKFNAGLLHASDPQVSIGTYKEIRQSSEQVSLRIGMHSISKHDKDIHKVSIATTLLGGYFGSRLMKTIREELGYTYGIYSTLIHTQHHNYWMISSELVKKHVENGLNEINRQIELLASTPPSKRELDTLKNYLKGKILSSVDSIFSKGNLIKTLKIGGLSDDFYTEYLSEINRITPEEVSDITFKYILEPEKTTLLVG